VGITKERKTGNARGTILKHLIGKPETEHGGVGIAAGFQLGRMRA